MIVRKQCNYCFKRDRNRVFFYLIIRFVHRDTYIRIIYVPRVVH